MDPLWASIAEFWWIAPTAVGAGTLGWFGMRGQRSVNERRLGYQAAKHQLREARADAAGKRVAVRIARAELAQTQGEKAASRATSTDVATARRLLQTAQANARSATAAVRTRRLQVTAARAALPSTTDAAALPLAKLVAEHDAVIARWMDYETDPAKLISFPAMTDPRVPSTAAYLRVYAETQQLRPATPRSPMTPPQFAAYRDAVARLQHAFDTAEHEAWRRARGDGSAPSGSRPPGAAASGWMPRAQDMINRSVEVLTQAGEVFTIAGEAMAARKPKNAPTPPPSARPTAPPTKPPAGRAE
ncbi:hypothetical protein [Microbacterium sp. P02]|uniref:hypothetical protein n=1 Tax=Microbacterium sp. P02 TaxID=3366260 RepID=UPI00366E8363